MTWAVEFHDEFEPEFDDLPKEVRSEIFAKIDLLETYGPELKRPHVDTLNGSQHSNMKELRVNANDGVWRIAFAFDPNRCAVLLVAGDKSGGSENYFYKQLIKKADARFCRHLISIREK